MVASSNAEAGYASNEHVVPTQLMGILANKKQVLKLLERQDRWIQCDIPEHQVLKLHRLSKKDGMDPDLNSSKALFKQN